MSMREQIIDKIVNYFNENGDVFNQAIEELDSYNGYLGDERYEEMELLDELYASAKPTDILARAFFGYDEDSWSVDSSGNKIYAQFNPNRDYFSFNVYGNLVSTDYKDYSGFNDRYAVEKMLEDRRYVDVIDENEELQALFDELEDLED